MAKTTICCWSERVSECVCNACCSSECCSNYICQMKWLIQRDYPEPTWKTARATRDKREKQQNKNPKDRWTLFALVAAKYRKNTNIIFNHVDVVLAIRIHIRLHVRAQAHQSKWPGKKNCSTWNEKQHTLTQKKPTPIYSHLPKNNLFNKRQ